LFWRLQVRWWCQELLHPHRPRPNDQLPNDQLPARKGATPQADLTLGTRDPALMRHIITVTRRIAEALASTFPSTLPHIIPIGTADPDIFIIGITAGIVISKMARSLALGASGQTNNRR
jgi:hypothetical protein